MATVQTYFVKNPDGTLTNVTLNANGTVCVPSGSATAPAVTALSSTTAGLYYPNANEVAISTNGSPRVTVDSSGRLLVGTSSSVGGEVIQSHNTGGDNFAVGRFAASAGSGDIAFYKSRSGTVGTNTVVNNADSLGLLSWKGADGTSYIRAATIEAFVDGTPGTNSMPGRIVLSTTASGASSPTERLRIDSNGQINTTGRVLDSTNTNLSIRNSAGNSDAIFEASNASVPGISGALRVSKNSSSSRSINAAGTVNQNGADYAEYFYKEGDFNVAKGDVVGINANGKLTTVYAQAVSYCVKSTDPGLVGGDNWFTEPRPLDANGNEVDSSSAEYAEWMERLEAARQTVDRIAFAGQVPVNVMGATPGQYIVPVEAADGGIEGIAKNEADLTLAEYMRAVGKVIAIEDDGRARIIVKVA